MRRRRMWPSVPTVKWFSITRPSPVLLLLLAFLAVQIRGTIPIACRTPLPAPEPVELSAPASDTLIHHGVVTFAWDSTSDASQYQLQVDDRTSFLTPVFDTVTATVGLVHFLPDGQYHWRVRAVSPESVWGEWSQVWAFHVATYRISSRMRTRGYPQGLDVNGDYVYIADGQAGLSIYDVSNPAAPSLRASAMDTTNSCYGVSVRGRYAYLAYGRKQLQIVGAANLDSLKMLGNIGYTTGYAYDIEALDTQYVVVANHGKFSLFDVRDPNFPILLYEPHAIARAVAVRDSIAYLACEQTGVLISRLSIGAPPVEMALTQTPGNARDVAVSGNLLCVADGRAGLSLLDVADPGHPRILGACPIPGGYANKVAVRAGLAYVAAGSAGLAVVDVSNPEQPVLQAVIATPYAKAVFATTDGRLFATDRDWGLLVVEQEDE